MSANRVQFQGSNSKGDLSITETSKGEWVRCGGGFIKADVIRWTESIWRKPRRKNGHAVRIGERTVTAEVLEVDGDWIELSVLRCFIDEPTPALQSEILANSSRLRRKGTTVHKSMPERLLWSDESARAELVVESAAK